LLQIQEDLLKTTSSWLFSLSVTMWNTCSSGSCYKDRVKTKYWSFQGIARMLHINNQ
jgi:hypothetical protein